MLADKSFSFSQTLVEFGYLLEEMGLISHGFFTDPKKASARLVYFAFQFGVSFSGAFYAPLLYECPGQAVLAIITINMVGVWHGLFHPCLQFRKKKLPKWKNWLRSGMLLPRILS